MKITYIHIKDRFEGFHYYPDAPPEVAFLKHRHRHTFYVEVHIQVFQSDRELEFFITKEQVKRACASLSIREDNPGSCENMANNILDSLKKVYGDNREYIVEVLEDDENGGVVHYRPDINNSTTFIPYIQKDLIHEHNYITGGENKIREIDSWNKTSEIP